MSETISRTTSRRTQKSTCRKCNRTVIVLEVGGVKVETDPELINVIPLDGPPAFKMARRAHADLCERYRQEIAKEKIRTELRDFNAKEKAKAKAKARGGRPPAP